jgi:hypothetical protein
VTDGSVAVTLDTKLMRRETKQFIGNYVVAPPLRVIGFVVKTLYWVLGGWWFDKRFNAAQQKRLVQEVEKDFWILFAQHNGRIVANEHTEHLGNWPIVTVAAEGLLFRFIRARDEQGVYVASEGAPSEWHDLGYVLSAVEPDTVARHSIVYFSDATKLLSSHWDSLKNGFSQERYPGIKRQLEEERRRGMAVSRQFMDELNRRLYGPEG